MNKYETESQLLFISSEANFESLGSQAHFKVDLNDQPFNNNDGSLLKMSVKEFNIAKNWYDINETNNKIRMFLDGFTSGGKTLNNIDTIVEIPVGNYVTHESVVLAFGNAVKAILIDTNNSDLVDNDLTVTSLFKTYTKYSNTTSDVDEPTSATKMNDLRFRFKIECTVASFEWDATPQFQCLNIGDGKPYSLYGGTTALSRDELLNDSYILLGGDRIETFYGSTSSPIYSQSNVPVSFSSKVISTTTDTFQVCSYYPMNTSLNTMPNLYITSRQSRSQASSSLEQISNEHAHNFINSSIIAKARREIDRDGGIYYRITQPSYFFANITASVLNFVEFDLRDNRGRLIPYPDEKIAPSGIADSDYDATNSKGQIKNGNSIVDMVLLVEKFIGQAPQKLQGFPPPESNPNPNLRSNLTIPRKIC